VPIYDIHCEDCEAEWESLQKLRDPLPACPKCSSSRVRKMVSRTSFSLKGKGWARDGYAKGQPKSSE